MLITTLATWENGTCEALALTSMFISCLIIKALCKFLKFWDIDTGSWFLRNSNKYEYTGNIEGNTSKIGKLIIELQIYKLQKMKK